MRTLSQTSKLSIGVLAIVYMLIAVTAASDPTENSVKKPIISLDEKVAELYRQLDIHKKHIIEVYNQYKKLEAHSAKQTKRIDDLEKKCSGIKD